VRGDDLDLRASQWADQLWPATDREVEFYTTGGQVPLNVRRPACALNPDGAHCTNQLGDRRALDVGLCHACRLPRRPFTRQRPSFTNVLEYNLPKRERNARCCPCARTWASGASRTRTGQGALDPAVGPAKPTLREGHGGQDVRPGRRPAGRRGRPGGSRGARSTATHDRSRRSSPEASGVLTATSPAPAGRGGRGPCCPSGGEGRGRP
jgi:hypothetical protein